MEREVKMEGERVNDDDERHDDERGKIGAIFAFLTLALGAYAVFMRTLV